MRVFRIALYLLERIFCKHDYVFSHNIFGDEINAVDGDRSWWKCAVCGKWETKVSLVTTLYKGEVREREMQKIDDECFCATTSRRWIILEDKTFQRITCFNCGKVRWVAIEPKEGA